MSFKPMLAATANLNKVTEDFFYSIKLEGVRGQFTPDKGLLTRQLKPFKNELMYERFDAIEKYCTDHNIMLEGEFYVHGWNFKRIDSCCRGGGNIDALKLEFHVFDVWSEDQPETTFERRYGAYAKHVRNLNNMGVGFVNAVNQYPFVGEADIRRAYAWALENQYEGICFKRKDLAYKLGRSTINQGYFLRIKPEDPYDGVVLGFIERQTNLMESETNELGQLFKRQNKDMKAGTGMVQNALVYTPSLGKVHKVAMTRGHEEADLYHLWDARESYVGRPIQWVGIPISGNDIPRSPRFDKWREDIQPTYLAHHESDCLMIEWDQAVVEHLCQEPCVNVVSKECFFECLEEGYELGSMGI